MTPKELGKELGKLGGKKTLKKHGIKYFKKISKLAHQAKRVKKDSFTAYLDKAVDIMK